MVRDRFVITDRMWALMEPHCLGKVTDPGRTGSAGLARREHSEDAFYL